MLDYTDIKNHPRQPSIYQETIGRYHKILLTFEAHLTRRDVRAVQCA